MVKNVSVSEGSKMLIENLAREGYFCSTCYARNPQSPPYKLPVMIGDVLNSAEVSVCFDEDERKERIYDIWCLWYEFGNQSLNEILSGEIDPQWRAAVIPEPRCARDGEELEYVPIDCVTGRFTDPNVQALYEFLMKLFGDKINQNKS